MGRTISLLIVMDDRASVTYTTNGADENAALCTVRRRPLSTTVEYKSLPSRLMHRRFTLTSATMEMRPFAVERRHIGVVKEGGFAAAIASPAPLKSELFRDGSVILRFREDGFLPNRRSKCGPIGLAAPHDIAVFVGGNVPISRRIGLRCQSLVRRIVGGGPTGFPARCPLARSGIALHA